MAEPIMPWCPNYLEWARRMYAQIRVTRFYPAEDLALLADRIKPGARDPWAREDVEWLLHDVVMGQAVGRYA